MSKLIIMRQATEDAGLDDDVRKGILKAMDDTRDSILDAIQRERVTQRRGILCNAVDDPPNCDFYFPAVVRRGDLQIAISTAGESPAFAQKIRRALEDALDVHLGDWLAAIGKIRRDILAAYPASEARKLALHVLASNGARESTTCPGRESSHAPEGAAFRPAEQQSRSIAIHTVHTR